jgi:hypothetical protein
VWTKLTAMHILCLRLHAKVCGQGGFALRPVSCRSISPIESIAVQIRPVGQTVDLTVARSEQEA